MDVLGVCHGEDTLGGSGSKVKMDAIVREVFAMKEQMRYGVYQNNVSSLKNSRLLISVVLWVVNIVSLCVNDVFETAE